MFDGRVSGVAKALLPREHGAYFELGFPLLTGLTVAGPTVSSAAIALAAVALFLAHEPLAVLSGLRGRRLQEQAGADARATFAVLVTIGALVGVTGIWLAGAAAQRAALVPLVLAAALVPWIIRRQQKSVAAELVVVAVFASLVLPVGAAGGMEPGIARIAAAVWFAGYVPGTIAVHALKLHHKGRPAAPAMRTAGVAVSVGAVGGAVGAAAIGWVPALAAVAVLPPAAAAGLLSARPVHPRHLKRVGWSLVGTSTVTWVCLLLL